jgi:hypothetical protein
MEQPISCHTLIQAEECLGLLNNLVHTQHRNIFMFSRHGDQFVMEKRRSYFNPCAPKIEFTVIEEDGSTRIEGSVIRSTFLVRMTQLSNAGIGLAVCLISWITWQLFTRAVGPALRPMFFKELTILLTLSIASFILQRYCQQHYGQLAEGEDDFLRSSLQDLLQAHSGDSGHSGAGGPQSNLNSPKAA